MMQKYQAGQAMPQQSQTDSTQQLFVQTIVLAPEVYKQLAGDQIPDDFVVAMKQVQQNPDMINAVAQQFSDVIQLCQQLFTENQEAIVEATQKLQTQKAAFKKGGKLDFFKRCFGKGGSISKDCGCHNVKSRFPSIASPLYNLNLIK